MNKYQIKKTSFSREKKREEETFRFASLNCGPLRDCSTFLSRTSESEKGWHTLHVSDRTYTFRDSLNAALCANNYLTDKTTQTSDCAAAAAENLFRHTSALHSLVHAYVHARARGQRSRCYPLEVYFTACERGNASFSRLKIMPFTAFARARYHATMTIRCATRIALCGALTAARATCTACMPLKKERNRRDSRYTRESKQI